MGSFISQYDPFSVYGNYNLQQKVYENKRTVLITLSFILVIVIGAIVMIWSTEGLSVTPPGKKYNFPPPRYGNGPYGYGVYLPPANIINASL